MMPQTLICDLCLSQISNNGVDYLPHIFLVILKRIDKEEKVKIKDRNEEEKIKDRRTVHIDAGTEPSVY